VKLTHCRHEEAKIRTSYIVLRGGSKQGPFNFRQSLTHRVLPVANLTATEHVTAISFKVTAARQWRILLSPCHLLVIFSLSDSVPNRMSERERDGTVVMNGGWEAELPSCKVFGCCATGWTTRVQLLIEATHPDRL